MVYRRFGTAEESLRSWLENGIHKDLATGCWMWTMACDSKGYPWIRHLDQILCTARASLFLHRQVRIDAKALVTRSCCELECVNSWNLVINDAG